MMHERRRVAAALSAALFIAASVPGAWAQPAPKGAPPPGTQPRGAPPPAAPAAGAAAAPGYSIGQSVSEKAQLSTIAFSGLAFMTGTFGADSFMPPGKVADYFGFQYMRDIDAREAGHNMMFLTNIGNNVLAVLDKDEEALLLALAKEQASMFAELGRKRLVLIDAFRRNLEGDLPSGSAGLSAEAVESFVGDIFVLDGKLALRRVEVYGEILGRLDAAQKAALGRLSFGDSGTWPSLPDQYDKRTMTHEEDVLYMTYASEFFSWYAGSETADVYFCPERHGTYFGGFYMKDYPAMGNADYFIPTALTGDLGEAFLGLLGPEDAATITGILEPLSGMLEEILSIRTAVSREFRKYLAGGRADAAAVATLSRRYGELDGRISYEMAIRFAAVYRKLDAGQKAAMVALRNQDVFPDGYYLYADPVKGTPSVDSTFLFAR